MPHGDTELGAFVPRSTFFDQGRFGRLFPTLPPFASDTPLVRAALTELGRPGGPMDAGDDLSDPIALITDPALSVNNPDNPRLSAGMTFLGQFLDHDMTFDPTSSLSRTQDPESIGNFAFNIGGILEFPIAQVKDPKTKLILIGSQAVLMVAYGVFMIIAGSIYESAANQEH